jgi:PII-like signaling protein
VLVPGEAILLRAFIGEDDAFGDMPLSDAVLAEARRRGLEGVTVLRGLAGYGGSAEIHRLSGLFSQDLPVVVEIIDTRERIEAFLPVLEGMMRGGLLTTQPLQIVRAFKKAPPGGDR